VTLTANGDGDLVKPLSYGLLQLRSLLISISKCFFSFLALVSADLVAFSAETLVALALSQASTKAFTSVSKDDI
jgi:hypothetical protein